MTFDFNMDTSQHQDLAGEEFDQWLNWNGAACMSNSNIGPFHGLKAFDPDYQFPISPDSTGLSDSHSSTAKSQPLTAPSVRDLPTPSHSSSSPEIRSSMDFRLSGDTLREQLHENGRSFLKRKLSPNDIPTINFEDEDLTPAAKKRPHNVIEKRYRANLNEKIAELRDSVPALRTARKASKAKDGCEKDSGDEDLDGLAPSNKLNKASVLSKAVEYIRHLEIRTRRLEDENKSLKERLEILDKVIAQGGNDAERTAAFTSNTIIEASSTDSLIEGQESSGGQANQPSEPPKGLIGIPESWRKLRQTSSQEHYGHMYDAPSGRVNFKSKWATRIMLGSLAGLMVMDGLAESDQGTQSREKGLFGIPLELLDGWKFLRSPRLYLASFAQFCRTGGIFPLVKGFLALTILAFLIFAYLFNSKPAPKEDIEEEAMRSTEDPSPASPIEVRRRAWSTSMQALHLPHHSFFPEWLAVTAEWLKYSFRYVFGHQAYTWLTGRTPDDDKARIKAWDIAIDAQLAGGDVEVSRSRVVLTSFGSGTLPRTPLRLMLKAMHCRVLLWNVGQSGSLSFRLWNGIGSFFAHREWQRARQIHEARSSRDHDRLHGYLNALLEMNCDDVFTDSVTQHAYDLMYDRSTSENGANDLMAVVVEDHAIRSPLDAVAAWRSTCALQSALELSKHCSSKLESLQKNLSLALRIAPSGSAAETRALAASAVLGTVNRTDYYSRVADIMASSTSTTPQQSPDCNGRGPFFIDSSTPMSARPDVMNVLHYAKTIQILDHSQGLDKALEHFHSVTPISENSTILSDATRNHVLYRLGLMSHSEPKTLASAGYHQHPCEVGHSDSRVVADADDLLMHQYSSTQISQGRRSSNASIDSGYGSQRTSLEMTRMDIEKGCYEEWQPTARRLAEPVIDS